jgi:glycolate oxidase iron-sulfur subunit
MTLDTTRNELDRAARECIHCGLCLESCPTYALSHAETESPRGRIHLMKALMEGRLDPDTDAFAPLDSCVGCRACETACPSGVAYGHLLEGMRADWVERPEGPARRRWTWLLNHLLIHPRRLRAAVWPARILQRVAPGLLLTLGRLVLGESARIAEMLEPWRGGDRPLPEWTRAQGESRGTVALLTGCVMEALYRPVHAASIRLLARAGFDVWVPKQQGCCGALHRHDGDRPGSEALMRRNLKAFMSQELVAVVTNSAGCGAAMKDYGYWLDDADPEAGSARAFASRVRDISEFLAEVGLPDPDRPIPLKAAYHEACHLAHGQRIRTAPRTLLERIPGLTLVPLLESDWCCGGAGSYALLQPSQSEALLARKLAHLAASGAEAVITGNPSCLMQLSLGLRREGNRVPIRHTVEILDQAYRESLS